MSGRELRDARICGYSTDLVKKQAVPDLGEFSVSHGYSNAHNEDLAVTTFSGPEGFPYLAVTGHRTGEVLDAYWRAFTELADAKAFVDVMTRMHALGVDAGREELQDEIRSLLGLD